MLELYHWEPNGSALKTLVCLAEKGLDYESHYVDLLAFEQYDETFLALNRDGQVPVLVHDGKVLTESQFINEYLDEVFPESPLRPEDAADLWRMRVWGKFTGEVLAPAASTIGCHTCLAPKLAGRDLEREIMGMPTPERQAGWRMAAADSYGSELLADSHRKVGDAAGLMEDRLVRHHWLVGDSYSLADIEMFAWMNAMEELVPKTINAESTPGVTAWLARVRNRPAVQSVLGAARIGPPTRSFVPGPEHSRWG